MDALEQYTLHKLNMLKEIEQQQQKLDKMIATYQNMPDVAPPIITLQEFVQRAGFQKIIFDNNQLVYPELDDVGNLHVIQLMNVIGRRKTVYFFPRDGFLDVHRRIQLSKKFWTGNCKMKTRFASKVNSVPFGFISEQDLLLHLDELARELEIWKNTRKD